MKIIVKIVFLAFLFFFVSCAERYSTRTKQTAKVTKTHQQKNKKTATAQKSSVSKNSKTSKNVSSDRKLVLKTAMSYLGTPYKYGGTNRSGFDCSGFVNASFAPLHISLNRSSDQMANQGESVSLKKLKEGDLLFFVTGRSGRISHVGIVVETGSEIKFIHSSTSKGVIISSLREEYWSKAYRKAKRILM